MSKKLIVIKLGGSVVTDKSSSTPKPNLDIIDNLSAQIKNLFETKKYNFILVHGAGSFGHPIAKKYSLHQGMKSEGQKLAVSQIQLVMLDLNKIIMKSLVGQNLPVISFPPHSFIIQSAGKFKSMATKLIQECLSQNQIPVLFGDTVFDDQWGCSILSGDTIVSFLAKKLGANKIIFLSDVNGIFEENPKINPKAKVISLISNNNLKSVLKSLSPISGHDVTGEMEGKILSIRRKLLGKDVRIISGLVKNNLVRAMHQPNQVGTKLLFG